MIAWLVTLFAHIVVEPVRTARYVPIRTYHHNFSSGSQLDCICMRVSGVFLQAAHTARYVLTRTYHVRSISMYDVCTLVPGDHVTTS